MTIPDDTPDFDDPGDPGLLRDLAAYSMQARHREGLEDRLFDSTVDLVCGPSDSMVHPSARASRFANWPRLAMAACVLLAFAVSVRLALDTRVVGPGEAQQDRLANSLQTGDELLHEDLAFGTDREAVVAALLDAGETGYLAPLDELEGTDGFGLAFAPILGTTGFEFDDLAVEIQGIQIDMRR
ncbi:MAG: hypothetical protein VXX86_02955 [Planctomycetota bacterium]|nr:hypothetical protein [Planctomycetota bacterium]